MVIATFASAGIIKGNLGPDKMRTVSITTGDSTFLPVIVMNDNVNSDFDIFVVDIDGDLICSSISTIRQIEKGECGLPPESDFDIVILNFSGPGSQFRLYIGDEISVTSGRTGNLEKMFGEGEFSLGDLPARTRDQIRRMEARKK
jgi:hypothetical protein